MVGRAKDPVRCLAARAPHLPGRTSQRSTVLLACSLPAKKELTTSQVARRSLHGESPEPCVGSPINSKRNWKNIAAAARFASDGTPIVAVNGRKGVSFPPFLYAMVRREGLPPSRFASLPPPTRTPICTLMDGRRVFPNAAFGKLSGGASGSS